MATKKAAGSTKNGRDSNPKFLGIKVTHGAKAFPGAILVRQRGTWVLPGRGVSMGKDHTIFSLVEGTVEMSEKKKTHFDGKVLKKKVISVK